MKLLLTLALLSIGALSALRAHAAGCEKKIIFLPELLSSRGPMYPGPVALSQFMILQALQKNPQAAVFTENIREDLSKAQLQDEDSEMVGEFKRVFPKGVPQSFAQLNEQQRGFLIANGGDLVAFFSGGVANLYAALNGHEELTALADHERKALGEVKAFFAIFPETKVAILVMNADYNPTRQSDLFPTECIETPPEVKDLIAN